VSQQPHPGFRFEGQKYRIPHPVSARCKTELEKFSLLSRWSSGKWLDNCQFKTRVFLVFDFSFDVLTQKCMSKLLDPLW